ncbi:MAG: hypothetical protein KJ070_09890 [Verrucomicrobia bacterium]|nr:hypothetical protein [Verrucomicrobiota bacterium]
MKKLPRVVVLCLAGWMLAVSGLVLVATWQRAEHRAVIGMAWGLIVFWIGGCGLAMWYWRELLCRLAAQVHLPWQVKFVVGCTALALTEEAITTLMTNCAPLFGVQVGEAYITASANYFDVVLYHSVVVFVPMFIGWAVLLHWWRFSPFAVFLLFGVVGLLAETISFGLQNLGNFAFWIFVYGLMVWLPAHWAPPERSARPPRWWAYPIALVVPFLFLPLMGILAPWLWLTPKHPNIHFPPIGGGP